MALTVAAGAATALKSDPDNYYLDPDEIRPIIRDSIETTIMLSAGGENTKFSGVEEFDVRLIPGQLPMYTIDGHLGGYLYIAYAVPGPLPTFEEIINCARENYDIIYEYIWSDIREEPWREFWSRNFPYRLTCSYQFVGTTRYWLESEESAGFPPVLIYQKGAENAARDYYGSDDFEFVRYIYCSKLNGYEFTNGRENIIVPYDTLKRWIYPDEVKSMADVEAEIEKYIYDPGPRARKGHFERWKSRLLKYYSPQPPPPPFNRF